MSDCRFGVSPVNYPDSDPDPVRFAFRRAISGAAGVLQNYTQFRIIVTPKYLLLFYSLFFQKMQTGI